MEIIGPVRSGPTWTSAFSTCIGESRQEAIEYLRSLEADVQVFSDGSGFEGVIGAAAVLYRGFRPPKVLRMHLGPDTEHTVYEGECVGQMLAVELIRREENIRTAIFAVDSQATIHALDSINTKPGHYLFDQVHCDVERLKEVHENVSLHVAWVPGHEGVKGNEAADKEAKKAAQGYSNRQLTPFLRKPLPISKSAAKQAFMKALKDKTKRMFKKSPRYGKVSRIDPSLPPATFRRDTAHLPRRNTSILIQLRTGHIALNRHLHRINRADSPECPSCHGASETTDHFLFHCPAYEGPRRELRNALGQAASQPRKLLGDKKAWPSLFRYINATHRFEENFGELSTAEVPERE